jgi:pimeloyl-ACP methyl ester carboxylesterase
MISNTSTKSPRGETRRGASGWSKIGSSGSKIGIGLGMGAAALAGAAAFNAGLAKRTERENPPRGNVIKINGADVHYVDSGTPGPTVVLLHGNGTTLDDWFAADIFQQLSRSARVIALDRPGFGYSTRPRSRIWSPAAQADLLGLTLKSLGADQVTVVGHSFATLVTVALAIRHPELVKSIVLMSGYYYPSARADVLVAAIPAVPVLGDIDRYSVAPLFGLALRPIAEAKIFAPAPVAASWKLFPFAMTLRPGQLRAEAADAALMVPSAAEWSPRYASLTIPVTIISGEGDQIVDHASQSGRLASTLPEASMIALRRVGHMIHHTSAERVLQAIQATLDQAAIGDD